MVQGRSAGYDEPVYKVSRTLQQKLSLPVWGMGCSRPSLKDSEMPGFLETLPKLCPTPTPFLLLCGMGTAQGSAGLASLPLLGLAQFLVSWQRRLKTETHQSYVT